MRVAITTLGNGGWYHKGVARLIQEMEQVSPGYEIKAYINERPPGSPSRETAGEYYGYTCKPFVVKAAMEDGVDIVLHLDASIRPIRHIQPLVDHISSTGHLFVAAGFNIGQWSTDEALRQFNIGREDALRMPDCLSGCVGIDLRLQRNRDLVNLWCDCWPLFAGFHSNVNAASKKFSYRNEGFVSEDPRVLGHRHDQTVLSLLAHKFGMTDFVKMPRYLAYYGTVMSQETALFVQGM